MDMDMDMDMWTGPRPWKCLARFESMRVKFGLPPYSGTAGSSSTDGADNDEACPSTPVVQGPAPPPTGPPSSGGARHPPRLEEGEFDAPGYLAFSTGMRQPKF